MTGKGSSTFSGKKSAPSEKILATPMCKRQKIVSCSMLPPLYINSTENTSQLNESFHSTKLNTACEINLPLLGLGNVQPIYNGTKQITLAMYTVSQKTCHPLVRQHILGVVDDVIHCSVGNLTDLLTAKEF